MKQIEHVFHLLTVVALAASILCFLDRCLSQRSQSDDGGSSILHRRLTEKTTKPNTASNRLLYIVTSIHEFDIGRRETVKGYDRFTNTLVPVIRESISSMIDEGYQPDVYLITQYDISNYRYAQLRVALPKSVGLQVWSAATPLMYMQENDDTDRIQLHTRGLARQHRYVIKDKLMYYDAFVNFEDDMLVRGPHVQHFVNLTNDIYHWRRTAGRKPTSPTVEMAKDQYYGDMTQQQLGRTIPGFIRVEAALPDFIPLKRNRFEQIPIRYEYEQGITASLDPSICCRAEHFNGHVPASPSVEDLYFWETSIEALGVRRLPNDKNWVVLLGGSNNEVWEFPAYVVGDFWSGRAGDFFHGKDRPDRKKGRYMSNQGGWMGTRRQIKEWHERWCRGGFLPYVSVQRSPVVMLTQPFRYRPYDPPHYNYDGLDLRSVEYWSGGIQLVGVNSCNLQRVVSLDPSGFSRSLLYHTSNNKQRAVHVRPQFSGRNVQEFWGQLVGVKQVAEAAIGT